MWKRFCVETPMHGFRDLHESPSKIFTIFWFFTLTVASGMTCFQIYVVVKTFQSAPMRTEISVLPTNEEVRYPPLLFRAAHFSWWIDFEKLTQYKFDSETFLYAMSYFQDVYSPFCFDVMEANKKLKQLMSRESIENMSDLGFLISRKSPSVATEGNFTRHVTLSGKLVYVLDSKEYIKNSSVHPNFQLYLKTFKNYEIAELNQQFISHFNQNLADEYVNFYKRHVTKTYNMKLKHPLSSFPFYVNPSGMADDDIQVDISQANYEFKMKATLYKWMPSVEKNCQMKTDAFFHTQCSMKSYEKFKFNSVKNCTLFFPQKNGIMDFNNSCYFDRELIGRDFGTYNETDSYKFRDDCNLGCTRWQYEFFERMNLKESDDNFTNNDIDGTIKLIYDNSDNVMMVSLLPAFTWYEAVANVGGHLGLWLGGSVISFIQVLYICCCIPTETWFNSRVQERVKPVAPSTQNMTHIATQSTSTYKKKNAETMTNFDTDL